MVNKSICFLVLLWCSFLSCAERAVEYSIPFEGTKLVLKAILQDGFPGEIRIHRSFDPARPTSSIAVTDASVYLRDESGALIYFFYSSVENEFEQGSLYRSTEVIRLKAATPYQLVVETLQGEQLITDEVFRPESPLVDSIKLATIPFDMDRVRLSNTILWLSQLQEQSGYLISLAAPFFDETGVGIGEVNLSNYFSPPKDANRTANDELQLYFNDRLFFSDGNQTLLARDSLFFTIEAISPVYAQWLAIAEDLEAELGGFSSTFAKVPNNTQGGYGIFGLSSFSSLSIKF